MTGVQAPVIKDGAISAQPKAETTSAETNANKPPSEEETKTTVVKDGAKTTSAETDSNKPPSEEGTKTPVVKDGSTDAQPKAETTPTDSESKKSSSEEAATTEQPVKKLTVEEKVGTIIADLHSLESRETKESIALMKKMLQMYWSHRKQRCKIGDYFVNEKFAELLAENYKTYNTKGIFINDDVWFNAYYTLNCCWNYSDGSFSFAKDLAKNGFIELMAQNIGHEPYLASKSTKNVYYVLKSSLSILQNISRAIDTKEEYDLYETANVKELLRKNFLSSEDDFTRTLATMILTSLISEEENKMLTDNNSIPFIVTSLGKAVNDKMKRRHRGFSPTELVECIARMSINDKNKLTIVDKGALPHLVAMLQYDDAQEKAEAAHTIWNLSFDASLRPRLRDEPGLIAGLDDCTKHEDKKVKKYANGALWTLNEATREVKQDESVKTNDHVFISYAWANQATVRQINTALQGAGFRTWVDFEQMGGSTLEAMASAIENAAVVLICASEKYKQSPNCRTEAEYTFQIKKPILPLMMQRYYKPDGWLGMLLGAKFYVNFDGKYDFHTAFNMLQKELAGRGRDQEREGSCEEPQPASALIAGPSAVDTAGPSAPVTIQPSAAPLTMVTPGPPAPQPAPRRATPEVSHWTPDKVTEFFSRETLSGVRAHFSDYDGPMLSALVTLRRESAQFFYSHLQDRLGLDLRDILRLTAALDSLGS